MGVLGAHGADGAEQHPGDSAMSGAGEWGSTLHISGPDDDPGESGGAAWGSVSQGGGPKKNPYGR